MDKDSSFLMERSDRYSMLVTPSLALAFGTGLLPRGEVGPTGAFVPAGQDGKSVSCWSHSEIFECLLIVVESIGYIFD